MKLSELKDRLNNVKTVNFVLPDGTLVPGHFHITEAGLTSRHFIDCGGMLHTEKAVNLQVWSSNDTDHRLEPNKLLKIISLYEKQFGNEDLDIVVEYQTDTVGKYGLDFQSGNFLLTAKQTECLAKDNCGSPKKNRNWYLQDLKLNLAALPVEAAAKTYSWYPLKYYSSAFITPHGVKWRKPI